MLHNRRCWVGRLGHAARHTLGLLGGPAEMAEELMGYAEAAGEVLLSADLAEEVGAEVECFSFEVGGKGTGGPEASRARYTVGTMDRDFEASGL